jgi:hypothetical protein
MRASDLRIEQKEEDFRKSLELEVTALPCQMELAVLLQ